MVVGSMFSSDWITVASLAAFTLQMLRASIDLIQVASKPVLEKELASVNNGPGKQSNNGSKNKSAAKDNNGISSNSTSTRYGSIDSSKPNEKVSNESKKDGANDDEEQPLLNSTASSPQLSQQRNAGFLAAWILLCLVFLVAGIGPLLPISSSMTALLSSIFPKSLVGSSIGVLLLEIYLFTCNAKERSSKFQRFLHLWTALILWLEYVSIACASKWPSLSMIATISWFNLLLLSAATIHLVVVLIDDYSTPAAGAEATSSGGDAAAAKAGLLSRKALFALLKPYVWPDATDCSAFWNRLRAIATLLCVIMSKICNLTSPLFLGWASTALAHEDYVGTMRNAILYSVVSWGGSTFKEAQSLFYLKVAQVAYVQLATTAFSHLHELSLDWHLRKKMGSVLRSMTRGIAACDTLMTYLFLWVVPALAECLVVCVIFATYFHYLPLSIAIFYFVFVYVVWTILVTLWRKKFRKALVQSDNEMEDRFVDSMINFETVKYFTAEAYERDRFRQAVQHYQAGSVHVQASLSFLNISQQVILKVCLATALSLAAFGIRQRLQCCLEMGCDAAVSDCCQRISTSVCPGMQVGDFVAVLTYTLNLFAPLNFLGSIYNAVVMAIVDLTSMSELLAEAPDVTDAPDAIELPKENAKDKDIAVEFDNVYFHYDSQPASNGLQGLSFKMKRGTTTAIVGPTGAGKTTVSRLLFRFYDVLSGAVKVNGVDVRAVTQQSLRRSMGVVPQAASLFNDTIKSNLLYGRRDATHEELVQAARDSQILSFIESLDDGWETMVGDRGMKLSGGEKQRAAICRCLLKNPDFVLLDEATSALDTLTENSIQEALDRLGEHRTVLVIAHRLGTVRNADNIIVLKDGVVAEQGKHEELMARNGLYAEMWNMQLHSTADSIDNASVGSFSNNEY